MAADTEKALKPEEEVSVVDWRETVLLSAGVSPLPARRLAMGSSDLHKMVEAKEHGCSDTTLVDIFL